MNHNEPLTCAVCNGQFVPARYGRAVVCSAQCGRIRKKKLRAARSAAGYTRGVCIVCGGPRDERGAKSRCSRCYQQFRRENAADYRCEVDGCGLPRVSAGLCSTHNTRKARGHALVLAVRDCPSCEEPFMPAKLGQIFCGRRCASREEARRRLNIERPSLVRACWWCDKTFGAPDGRRMYCGSECTAIGSKLDGRMAKYGLSREQYRTMYREQGGLCLICKKPERTARNRLLCVDHDHETGHVKGLLCSHCNRGLGLFGDDPRVLRLAADYVARSRQPRLIVA